MGLFKRKTDDYPYGQNFLFILDKTNDRIEVVPVDHETAESVHTRNGIFPREDLQTRFIPEGGTIHLINCSLEYLKETEHLASLEESIVMKNVFSFQRTKTLWDDMKFFALLAALLIVVLIMK